MQKCTGFKYRLNDDQKKLLLNEKITGKRNIKHHLEKLICKEILIEKGILNVDGSTIKMPFMDLIYMTSFHSVKMQELMFQKKLKVI